jgi:hypothetical protein
VDHGTEIVASNWRAEKASTWGALAALMPGCPNLVRSEVANLVVHKRLAGSNPVPGAIFAPMKNHGFSKRIPRFNADAIVTQAR